MTFMVIPPAVVGMLPGIDPNCAPGAGAARSTSRFVCKEMLSGIWHWDYIALIFGSSCVYAGIALALAVRMFNREDVIFRRSGLGFVGVCRSRAVHPRGFHFSAKVGGKTGAPLGPR